MFLLKYGRPVLFVIFENSFEFATPFVETSCFMIYLLGHESDLVTRYMIFAHFTVLETNLLQLSFMFGIKILFGKDLPGPYIVFFITPSPIYQIILGLQQIRPNRISMIIGPILD